MTSADVAALLSFLCGASLIVGGVYVLLGLGWALISGAVPFLLLAVLIVRGLR